MIIVEMTFAKTELFLPMVGVVERVQRSMGVSLKWKHSATPVRDCDDSAKGKKEDQEASYKPDYTGAFITDWEIPGEIHDPKKGRKPEADFIVDWIN